MSEPTPGKRRTRQHVIAAQSANYVERFVIDEGHTAQRVDNDYGYDLLMATFDEDGYAEPGLVYIQLKATESLVASGSGYAFQLDTRDYHLWLAESMPVILILFDAARRRAYWLDIQRYFKRNEKRKPKNNAKTVRVRVPKRNSINHRAIRLMRIVKQQVLARLTEGD